MERKPIAIADRARRVQQRIYADRPQCVAVVGDPRIGKSSFLAWLMDSAGGGDPPPPPGTRFVEMALRNAASSSPDEFLGTVLERLALDDPAGDNGGRGSVAPGSSDAPTRAYRRFETAVERISAGGGRLILLLDDFDCVTGSGSFPLQFFSFMRSLANNFPVAYVTTSRLDLQRLCALKEVEESPFFNIFQNVSLGPMGEPQIRALVESLTGEAAGAVADWAVEQSGGLPAVVVACCEAAASGAEPGTAAGEAVLDAAVAGYFGELWDHLDPPHRDLVGRVAAGGAPGERDARPLRDLGPRRGYLRELEDGWVVASCAFERFVSSRTGSGRPPGLITRVRRLFGGSVKR